MSSVQFVPVGDSGFRCTVVSDREGEIRFLEVLVSDANIDDAATWSGQLELQDNQALQGNLLNYGVREMAARGSNDDGAAAIHRKAAKKHAAAVVQLADLVNAGSFQTRRSWCSSCFELTDHRIVDGNHFPQAALCSQCGEIMTPCGAAGCRHMARRGYSQVQLGSFCAEHRHEIRGFDKVNETYSDLDAVTDLHEFNSANLARVTRTVAAVGVGVLVVAPAAIVAAPAIGGALGVSGLIGPALSGAAASSHGLAFLGGGAIAAGGFGMAGGTAVVTAVGAALGGSLGAVSATAYLRADKSFRIEKLRDGEGPSVLVSSGFLTAGSDGWGDWKRLIDERYPDNPVYRVHWGAKELASIGLMLGAGGGAAGIGAGLKIMAAQANKAAARIVPLLGAAAVAQEMITNPWHVAKSRADQTAAILADLLARIPSEEFVFVGHSLGGRVMLRTAEILATSTRPTQVQEVHLLAAAIGTGRDWEGLNNSVVNRVWNYHSHEDQVLKKVYPVAQLGQAAVGAKGIGGGWPNITDVDVSEHIKKHSEYHEAVRLRE